VATARAMVGLGINRDAPYVAVTRARERPLPAGRVCIGWPRRRLKVGGVERRAGFAFQYHARIDHGAYDRQVRPKFR
jgi:hypothetical protein